jgi:hypothetical protein
MLHGEFIEKMAKYKPWHEYQPSSEGKNTTSKAVANKFGVKPIQVSIGIRFYDRHKDEPQRPEYAAMTHKSVLDASHFLKLSSMDELRQQLIKHYGAMVEDKIRPYQKFVSRRIIRQLLDKSGLEWFEKNNRPFVHWKHCA